MLENPACHRSHLELLWVLALLRLPILLLHLLLVLIVLDDQLKKPKFSSKALVAFPLASEAMRGGSMDGSELTPGASSFFSLAFRHRAVILYRSSCDLSPLGTIPLSLAFFLLLFDDQFVFLFSVLPGL